MYVVTRQIEAKYIRHTYVASVVSRRRSIADHRKKRSSKSMCVVVARAPRGKNSRLASYLKRTAARLFRVRQTSALLRTGKRCRVEALHPQQKSATTSDRKSAVDVSFLQLGLDERLPINTRALVTLFITYPNNPGIGNFGQ